MSFGFGFAFNIVLTNATTKQPAMKRVTGIGGIFFKCNDPAKMKEWYKTHLGFSIEQYGTKFDWKDGHRYYQRGLHAVEPFL